MARLVAILMAGHALNARRIREDFGVSRATSKRDMQTLRTVFRMTPGGKLSACPVREAA